ncbi:hypothetical protein MIND_00149300 [Mycena indigotica]|uniref:Uncharacterized protein n=1 Tax=Mycena indigotica TaxID=2126181 RepID=A0A8H6WGV3_9AGAR|nr:uncharacterized protein MIND_00149300 [Mycena indigotica]KAF7316306.1 hypothetical protein MIND_00149300 [Mycena indigotica]
MASCSLGRSHFEVSRSTYTELTSSIQQTSHFPPAIRRSLRSTTRTPARRNFYTVQRDCDAKAQWAGAGETLFDYAVVTVDQEMAAPPLLSQQPNSEPSPSTSTATHASTSTPIGEQQSQSSKSTAAPSSIPSDPTASSTSRPSHSRLLLIVGGILGAVGAVALVGIMIPPPPQLEIHRVQSGRLPVMFRLISERLQLGRSVAVPARMAPQAFLETVAHPTTTGKNPANVVVQDLNSDPTPALERPQTTGTSQVAEHERRLRVLEGLMRAESDTLPPAYVSDV